MAWVAAFCLGPFGGNERTWKPFNPILGETFELDKENGVRFLAEQVKQTATLYCIPQAWRLAMTPDLQAHCLRLQLCDIARMLSS